MSLQLALCGPPICLIDGRRLAINKFRKPFALLSYLAVEQKSISRVKLATLLWPELTEKNSFMNLRKGLLILRREVGQYIKADHHEVRFNSELPYTLDIEEIQRLHDTTDSAEPNGNYLQLYRGEFMEGIHLRQAEPFELWIERENAFIRETFLNRLNTFAQKAHTESRYNDLVHFGKKIVSVDPYREEGYRFAMLGLALSGQRSAALKQFELCKERLWDGLGTKPDQATGRLATQIEAGDLQPQPSGPGAVFGHIKKESQAAIHNLPARLTPFFGREREIKALIDLIQDKDQRLITILGAGGVGKSRLSLEVGHRLKGEFEHGTWFVRLDGLEPATAITKVENKIANAIANAIGLPLQGKTSPREQLIERIKQRHLLLILDNFEPLLEGAKFILDLLEQAPHVTILVTSRDPLRFLSEFKFRLGPLDRPNAHVGQKKNNAALQLFEDRAKRSMRRFSLSKPEHRAVAIEICRLVEGIPLGIELAAAGLDRMSPQELLSTLSSSFDALASSLRDIPLRHRSMRIVFEESFARLDPQEQLIFSRCALFRGGFEIEAFEAVTGGSPHLLNQLWLKSLLQKDDHGRYRVHELLRQFAMEKLLTLHDDPTLAHHATYYLNFVTERNNDLTGQQPQLPAGEIFKELDNIRTAWASAVKRQTIQQLLPTIAPLATFYELKGYYTEGIERFGQAAAYFEGLTSTNDKYSFEEIVSALRLYHIRSLVRIGDYDEAQKLVGQYLTVPLIDKLPMIGGHYLLAQSEIFWRLGNYTPAKNELEKVFNLSEQNDFAELNATAHYHFGTVCIFTGEKEVGLEHLNLAYIHWKKSGNFRRMAQVLNNRGLMLYHAEDLQAASFSLEEALKRNQKIEDSQAMINVLMNLGLIKVDRRDFSGAHNYLNQALSIGQQVGDRFTIIQLLLNIAWVYIAEKRGAEANSYLESARTQFNLNEYPSLDATYYYYSGRVALVKEDALSALTHLTKALEIAQHLQHANLIKSVGDTIPTAITQLKNKEQYNELFKNRSDWELIEQYL